MKLDHTHAVLHGAGSSFTTAVELREARQLVVSLMHHIVLKHGKLLVKDDHVASISYLDLGVQVSLQVQCHVQTSLESISSSQMTRDSMGLAALVIIWLWGNTMGCC